MRSPRAVEQFVRFAVVGVGNTLVSLGAFVLLTHVAAPAMLAGAAAFGAGAVNGYVLNARWTFACRGSKPRYLAVQLAGLGMTTVLAGTAGTAGYLVGLPVVTLVTFAANRRWTFSDAIVPR